MKTREEIAKFMEGQMSGAIDCPTKKSTHHYGKCELRQLMDFIFDGPPTCKAEEAFEPLRMRNNKVGKWQD